jgi:hypothetical protein
MLKALRHHQLMVGTVEVLVDVARYLVIVLVALLLVDSSRRSRSEVARSSAPIRMDDHDGADAIERLAGRAQARPAADGLAMGRPLPRPLAAGLVGARALAHRAHAGTSRRSWTACRRHRRCSASR